MKVTLLLHSTGDAMITSSITLHPQPGLQSANHSSDVKIKRNNL